MALWVCKEEKAMKAQVEERKYIRNGIMLTLLRDFIAEGFPSPDPIKQIHTAFVYANLFARFAILEVGEEENGGERDGI